MDREIEIVRDTQALHSDMQTLVYENYNKFISATDTIRKVSATIYIHMLSHVLHFDLFNLLTVMLVY
jgi:hypothetical protein